MRGCRKKSVGARRAALYPEMHKYYVSKITMSVLYNV